jgi:uncharacterized protein YdaU (DUF1376 family)
MNFYKHWLGDYARDTADLSLLEHGAYRVLLDHYYAQRGEMPADLTKLELVCKARSSVERRAVQDVANRFFPVNGDGRRHNKRADSEIASADAYAKAQAERAHMRWHSHGNASHSHSHSQKKQKTPTPDGVGGRVTATDCPQQQLIDLYHELLPMCPRVEKWTPARQQMLRARWRDEAKPNREKHDGYTTVEAGLTYWRRFFGYCSTSDFLTGKKAGRGDQPPFLAKLSWLIKAENFAKVIEGDYHR